MNYEYLTVWCWNDEIEDAINDNAKEGWRVKCCTSFGDPDFGKGRVFVIMEKGD